MKRSLPSPGLVNSLSFVHEAILSSAGVGAGIHIHKLGSWKDLLRLAHSVGLTLLGAGTIGALLLLRQVSPSTALSWILQPRLARVTPDLSSVDPSDLTIPGLCNAGNNCFLNAVLQALASSHVLQSFLAAYDCESILPLFDGVENRCPPLPLTEALLDLLAELSELCPVPGVANPRHVMRALEPYARQFDLSLQQDAAEALAHLANALQEERATFFESLRAFRESFSDAARTCVSGSRTVIGGDSSREPNSNSLLDSWMNQLCWPMEGTMGSTLTCQECGFQFSTQFQSFHDVPLSPPRLPDGNIVDRCRLEACLEQYTAPEWISSVRCSRCSHSFNLCSLQGKQGLHKALLGRVKECTFEDDCSCTKLFTEEGETWRNVYVNARKQLRFGRCPEVLCCHMQRAIVNRSGDVAKWTGHVAFPLVLNLRPYVMSMQAHPLDALAGKSPAPPLMDHGEVLKQLPWPRFSLDLQSKAEFDDCRATSSTDVSSSDDIHMSISSRSEDMASDTSSDEVVEKQLRDYGESRVECSQLNAGINSIGSMDPGCFGLDRVLFSNLEQRLSPPDDRKQLLLRCQENGDGAMLSESASHVSQNYLAIVNNGPHSLVGDSMVNSLTMPFLVDSTHGNHEADAGQGRWSYDLISVVVHHGSPRNGHYTVYRKVKLKKGEDACSESSASLFQMNAVDVQTVLSDRGEMKDPRSDMLKYRGSSCPGLETGNGQGTDGMHVNSNVLLSCQPIVEQGVHMNVSTGVLPRCSEDKFGAPQVNVLRKESRSSRVPIKDEIVLWFRVSDAHVHQVTVEEVLNAQASLLFYERSN